MAIYGWIYANAKRNENLDYCSRGGHKELKQWGLTTNMDSLLPRIASRLISPNYRNDNKNQRPCWFAGYLDKEKYMVAVGGTQEALLGMPIDGGGFRLQLCVFAYIFTEKDICLYKCDSAMFEPLKEKLKMIQCTTEEEEKEQVSCLIKKDLLKYKLLSNEEFNKNKQNSIDTQEDKSSFNILKSTIETDNAVWLQSLQHPVAISVPTMEDAQRFLDLFPEAEAIATVIDGRERQYFPKQNRKDRNLSNRNLSTMLEVQKCMKEEKKEMENSGHTELKVSKNTTESIIDISKENNKIGKKVIVYGFLFVVLAMIFSAWLEKITIFAAILFFLLWFIRTRFRS